MSFINVFYTAGCTKTIFLFKGKKRYCTYYVFCYNITYIVKVMFSFCHDQYNLLRNAP